MSLTMMLAAGAALLILVALLIVQRRRTATTAGGMGNSATENSPPEDAASQHGLPMEEWRPLGPGGRLTAILRGRRHGIQLLREPGVSIYRARKGDAIRVMHEHDDVYGGRPRWTHVADLTRTMGKAERCWPGAELAGILSYTDRAVPVEYSPRLVADLEDESAPDPDGMSVA
jgi:hypothetical protein